MADQKDSTSNDGSESSQNTEDNKTEETTEASKGAENEKVDSKDQTPTRTDYSIEEFKSMESSKDTDTAAKEKAWGTERDTLAQRINELEDIATEEKDKSYLKSIEAEGGDIDKAKDVLVRERDLGKRERDVKKREAEADRIKGELDDVIRSSEATRLVKEHKLAEKDTKKLLEASDPAAMKTEALQLELAYVKSGKVPATTVDKGTTTGKGASLKDMTPSQILEKGFREINN